MVTPHELKLAYYYYSLLRSIKKVTNVPTKYKKTKIRKGVSISSRNEKIEKIGAKKWRSLGKFREKFKNSKTSINVMIK